MSVTRSVLVLSFLVGCVDKVDGGDSSSAPLLWYATCGDPVCSGYNGPFDGVALCTTETAGAACTTSGATCDPKSDCDALLSCTTEDPTTQPGGCPI